MRRLLARGGICRSPALREAYSDYVARHNAAVAAPRAISSRFLVYRICCGQLGNRIQSLVAAFVLALLSERTLYALPPPPPPPLLQPGMSPLDTS